MKLSDEADPSGLLRQSHRRRLRTGIHSPPPARRGGTPRIGPEPKWYIGACGKYLCGLLPESWRLLRRDPQKFLDTYRALQKLVLLDMGARH